MLSKYIFLICIVLFQGTSASFPAYNCNISQVELKTHGVAKDEHNFETVKCELRDFSRMEKHLKDQIDDLEDYVDEDKDVDKFCQHVIESDDHKYERQFRVRGKHHNSVIGNNNSAVESMEYAPGGSLHNGEILNKSLLNFNSAAQKLKTEILAVR